MRDRCYYTYIAASRTRVLYVGVTGNIEHRVTQHKARASESFTSAYRCHRLVWFERYTSASAAIAREKQLKGWLRAKKVALIERENSAWIDLSENWGKSINGCHPERTRRKPAVVLVFDVILSGATAGSEVEGPAFLPMPPRSLFLMSS